MTRDEALDQIAALARAHDLSLDEIGARLTGALSRPEGGQGGKWLVRLLGYLGAALIFGGLALFIGMQWDELGSAARVTITYGPGLAAFILGLITLYDPRFVNAATPLFLKSAILLPTGMFVFLHEYAQGNDGQLAALLVFGALAAQFLITFFVKRRTALLFFGYLFFNAAAGILMDRAEVPGDLLGLVLGLSILLVARALDATVHRAIVPFWYFIGGVGFLWSLFDILEGGPLDVLFLAASIGMMFVSVQMRSRTLLIVATFALLGYLGYFTEEYFKDVIGWPVALMVMGGLLVGISYWAVGLGRKIKAG